MFVGLDNLVIADSIASSHGKVGEECKGGDESCQNMEHAFLLGILSRCILDGSHLPTTGTLKAMP